MKGIVSTINGISLWYISQGQGIPLVLIHGGPGAYDYLEPMAGLFDYRFYQVIRYEQRGSWRSEKKGPYNVEIFIEDLEHLRIYLGIDKWVLCGHSWGASLALAYTAKYNAHVAALIYMSGTGINPAWHSEYRVNRLNRMGDEDRGEYTYLRSIVDTLNDEDKGRARDRIRELSLRTDLFNQNHYDKLPRVDGQFINNEVNLKVGSDCNRYMENEEFKKEILFITAPTLLVHGQVDPRPYKYVLELKPSLQNCEFRLIPAAGHYPWLDNPIELGKQITEFLSQKVSKPAS